MPKPKMIIFDQDGTLIDSSPGIKHSFVYTGKQLGRTDIPDDLLNSGLGGDFVSNITRILNLEPSQIEDAVNIFAAEYSSKGQGMVEPFDGVREALEDLRARGYRLAVATMMVEEYAVAILRRFGLLDYFETVRGTDLTKLWTKSMVIEMVLEETGMAKDDVYYIGDSKDDAVSAEGLGLGFIAASYGYGLPEDYCAENGLVSVNDPMGIAFVFD